MRHVNANAGAEAVGWYPSLYCVYAAHCVAIELWVQQ